MSGVAVGDEAEAEAQVTQAEELIILGNFTDAIDASLRVVRTLAEQRPAASDSLLQRGFLACLQAHYLDKRQHEVQHFIEELGLERLAMPTFLEWMLLLLESGQAPAARGLVERYMRLVGPLGAAGPCPGGGGRSGSSSSGSNSSNSRCGACCPSGRDVPAACGSGAGGGEARCAGACSRPAGGVAASGADRKALARLYTQDVLTDGLRLGAQALSWLGGEGAVPQGSGAEGGASAACGTGAGTGAGEAHHGPLVAAAFLGAEVAAELHKELLELRPGALAAAAAAGTACTGPAGRGAGGVSSSSSSSQAAAPSRGASAAPAPEAARQAASAGADARAAGTPAGAAGPTASGAHRAHAAPAPAASLSLHLRAAFALLRRVILSAASRLKPAAAWLACKAVVLAERLRGAAAAAAASLQYGKGASPLRNHAALLALAALCAVLAAAAAAEAPHLRAALRGGVGGVVGLVREALSMGLTMHTSPVATGR